MSFLLQKAAWLSLRTVLLKAKISSSATNSNSFDNNSLLLISEQQLLATIFQRERAHQLSSLFYSLLKLINNSTFLLTFHLFIIISFLMCIVQLSFLHTLCRGEYHYNALVEREYEICSPLVSFDLRC